MTDAKLKSLSEMFARSGLRLDCNIYRDVFKPVKEDDVK